MTELSLTWPSLPFLPVCFTLIFSVFVLTLFFQFSTAQVTFHLQGENLKWSMLFIQLSISSSDLFGDVILPSPSFLTSDIPSELCQFLMHWCTSLMWFLVLLLLVVTELPKQKHGQFHTMNVKMNRPTLHGLWHRTHTYSYCRIRPHHLSTHPSRIRCTSRFAAATWQVLLVIACIFPPWDAKAAI